MVGPGSIRSSSRRYTCQGGLSMPGPKFNMPSMPPTQRLIDILRTRGTFRPAKGPKLGTTVDLSAGQRKIAAEWPQYDQSGLRSISLVTSQFEELVELKSRYPLIQAEESNTETSFG